MQAAPIADNVLCWYCPPCNEVRRGEKNLGYAARSQGLVVNGLEELLHRLPKGLLDLPLAGGPACG